MKDTYTYKVSVSVDKKDSFGSISWEETFSRDDIKGFFSPKENTYYDLNYSHLKKLLLSLLKR